METAKGQKNDLEKAQYSFVMSIVEMIDNKEHSIGEHVRRTRGYAEIIIRELLDKGFYRDKLDEDTISRILNAAPLHDIGKLYTPNEILNKPGKLTKEEFEIMKLHTINGGKIIDVLIKKACNKTEYIEVLNCAKEQALYHHERWDGTGYPFGLSREDIPLSARITSIADVFDALTSKRVYRDALSVDEALRIILDETGKHFDPKIVSAFLSAFHEIKPIIEEKEKKSKNN